MNMMRRTAAANLAILLMVGAGCGGGGLTPEESERLIGSYRLPQDGVPNSNGSVGPFCCTGRTLVVAAEDAPDALGYVHFFWWEGQAYNLSETQSIAPDVRLDLQSREHLEDQDGALASGSIAFDAAELEPGARKRQRVGGLEYIVTVDQVSTLEHEGRRYFDMGSLEVTVDVLRVASP